MTKIIEMFNTAPKSSTLGQCDFCQLWFEHEDLFSVDDHHYCDSCRHRLENDVERRLIEEKFQTALNALPADELITLNWMLAIGYQQIEDKNGLDNVSKWNDRVRKALAIHKSLQP